MDNLSCLFCEENETVHHLFFGCCVPSSIWCHLSEIFNTNLGANFESVARWWISNKKNAVLNTCCAALMWCTWKLRNDLCFQARQWRSEKDLLLKLIKMLRNWRALCKAVHLQEMERVMEGLTVRLHQPLRLFWEPQATAPSSSSQMAAQSDSATSTGVVFRDIASTQDPSEDEPLFAAHLPLVDVSVSAGVHVSVLG